MHKNLLLGLLSGFVGGLMSAYLVAHLAAAATREDVVSAHRIQLVDSAGRTRALLAMSPDGGSGLFFYDTSGRNRLVLGLYAPAESEYPFVVLNDRQQQAAGIFRLFGAQETPVVVLKNKGRDRSIFGLNPNSTEPFLASYSNDGTKTTTFGNY